MTRRDWLSRVLLWISAGTALGGLGAILLDVWAAAGRFRSVRWVDVAALDEIPADGTVPFPEARVALVRRGERVGAVSLECTHLGCLVHTDGRGFVCPCHGSQFGPLGEVYTPPAPRSLPWHRLEVRRGRVWVFTGREEPQPVWTVLPGAEGA